MAFIYSTFTCVVPIFKYEFFSWNRRVYRSVEKKTKYRKPLGNRCEPLLRMRRARQTTRIMCILYSESICTIHTEISCVGRHNRDVDWDWSVRETLTQFANITCKEKCTLINSPTRTSDTFFSFCSHSSCTSYTVVCSMTLCFIFSLYCYST